MVEHSQQLESLFVSHLDVIQRRFARALEATGYTGVLIHSGSTKYLFADDNTYPFKVNAAFKVWAPITDVPECFVYFEAGRKPLLLFHSPVDYWHKPASIPEAYWTRSFDIRPIGERAAARQHLPQNLSRVAYLGDSFEELEGWGTDTMNGNALLKRVNYDRAAKTPYELACLREASRIGALGHTAAAQAFADGASELEIHLAYLEACGLREQELPYNSIIALNEGGAVLHYQLWR